ncbi:hypothetical protein QVD17_37206 [Tagetes erecta]|uniref:Uncharacterized protein n=1 Tax=Tagetes erecta TaxID=13708 RepID=A0AAD8JVK1_TARER|nr:hypothetical protein QVD17_37206 [Tagetes erecta]
MGQPIYPIGSLKTLFSFVTFLPSKTLDQRFSLLSLLQPLSSSLPPSRFSLHRSFQPNSLCRPPLPLHHIPSHRSYIHSQSLQIQDLCHTSPFQSNRSTPSRLIQVFVSSQF